MAAQPTRPPPNNLLFRGPPPTLPQVHLVPNDSTSTHGLPHFLADFTVLSEVNDADALQDINNVGVPTYEDVFDTSQLKKNALENDPDGENQPSIGSVLRRTHSFDISYVYTGRCDDELVALGYRQRRSEPDLSKYGLFVEADVAMEGGPMQPASLVLNNPFYDGSFALDPALLNPSLVALPENYLAFEDSFVPTWDYKQEYLNNTDLNPELYYETLPIVPSNDPWSVYNPSSTNIGYYSPQIEVPTEDGIQYMRLSELEFALPQYMSLPTVLTIDSLNDHQTKEHNNLQTENETNNNISSEHIVEKQKVAAIPDTKDPITTTILENNNDANADVAPTNSESSHSEESLNADVSNDVTSSLAFIPSSKSSQILSARDDTSDDTSPCSTDYQEASALTQSLGELSSSGDSTDFSQSRDDVSPTPAEAPTKVVPDESKKREDEPNKSNLPPPEKSVVQVPLCQLPSIPNQNLPTKLPPVPVSLPSMDSIDDKSKARIQNQTGNAKTVVNKTNKVPCKPPTTNQSEATSSNNLLVTTSGATQNLPTPPSVPPAWLSKTPTGDSAAAVNVQKNVPQICIQKAEGRADARKGAEKSPKATHQATVKATGTSAPDPQPSCSFAPPLPPHNSQLKPDKLPKEVEVSEHFSIALRLYISDDYNPFNNRSTLINSIEYFT